MASNVPYYAYDISADQDRLAAQRKIYEAMLAQSMQGGNPAVTMAGNVAIPNWGDAIGKVVQAYSAKHRLDDIQSQEQGLAKQATDRFSKAMQDYQTTAQPHLAANPDIGAMTGSLDSQDAPTQQTVVPGDQFKAAMGLFSSGSADAKALAIEQLKEALTLKTKGQIMPKDIMSNEAFTPGSRQIFAQTNNVKDLVPMPQTVTADGLLFDKSSGKIQPYLPDQPLFTPPQAGPQGIPVQTNPYGQVRGIQGGNVTPPALKGTSALETTLAENYGKELETGKTAALQAIQDIPKYQAAKGLISQASTGFGADQQQTALRIAKAFGVNVGDQSKISSSQELMALLAPNVLATVKHLGSGTGVSDKDLEFSQKATLSSLTNDPASMAFALDMATRDAVNKVTLHNRNVDKGPGAYKDVDPARFDTYRIPINVHGELGDIDPSTGLLVPKARRTKVDENGNPIND